MKYFLYVLSGALLFWGIDMIFVPIGSIVPTSVWIISKKILIPVIIRASYLTYCNKTGSKQPSAAFLALLGIWLTGPVYMFVLNIILSNPNTMSLSDLGMLLVYFPVATGSISTYSGALGALVITTILLLAMGFGDLLKNLTKQSSQ